MMDRPSSGDATRPKAQAPAAAQDAVCGRVSSGTSHVDLCSAERTLARSATRKAEERVRASGC